MKTQHVLHQIIWTVPLVVALVISGAVTQGAIMRDSIVFATYAETGEELAHAVLLIESLRTFGGEWNGAPVRVYIPARLAEKYPETVQRINSLNGSCHGAPIPSRYAGRMYYAGKVYAASLAEVEVEACCDVLVWMDADTVFLDAPHCLMLNEAAVFGYRPVMHNRSGVVYDAEPNPFWARIYDLLGITGDMMFPMVTPADEVTIQPYFNAGLLAVRPGAGILRRWVLCFEALCRDEMLVDMCMENVEHRIFLHQTALVGAVLPVLNRETMIELPDSVNYPLFFDRMYRAKGPFEDVNGKVTIRYDVYFRHPAPDWAECLRGDSSRVNWLKSRFAAIPSNGG